MVSYSRVQPWVGAVSVMALYVLTTHTGRTFPVQGYPHTSAQALGRASAVIYPGPPVVTEVTGFRPHPVERSVEH